MLLSYNVVPVNDCVPRSFVRRVNICFFIDAGGLGLIHSNLFSALRANLALRKFGRGYSVAYFSSLIFDLVVILAGLGFSFLSDVFIDQLFMSAGSMFRTYFILATVCV